MKWLIASDIHGSAYYCSLLYQRFLEEGAQLLILLGDILHHGPRNPLPKDYEPQKVCAILNGIKDSIVCVRGNCDSEVDQMLLNFPLMADYAVLSAPSMANTLLYATHGHIYNKDCPLPMKNGSVLLCGHTHIPLAEEVTAEGKHFTCINPGSVSLPKAQSKHSYICLENGIFLWKNIEDATVYKEYHYGAK